MADRTSGCGTYAGYARHYRRGERPCAACQAAQRAYQRSRPPAPPKPPPPPACCEQCGETFQPRQRNTRYCSKRCINRASIARRVGTCSQPGCDQRRRTQGLCTTHYNQTFPDRHPKVMLACEVCGTLVSRDKRNVKRYSTVCSSSCRNILTFGIAHAVEPYDWALFAAHRAREAGARVVELFDRLEVFERDEWLCYLCGVETDSSADPLHPRSPTVDHVIPLSRGGDHSLANARCACLGCNSSKGTSIAS